MDINVEYLAWNITPSSWAYSGFLYLSCCKVTDTECCCCVLNSTLYTAAPTKNVKTMCLESQWPVIMGYCCKLWATLDYCGLLFWATWLSRWSFSSFRLGYYGLVVRLIDTLGSFRNAPSDSVYQRATLVVENTEAHLCF